MQKEPQLCLVFTHTVPRDPVLRVMSPFCAAKTQVRNQEAEFILHKDSQERKNTLTQVLGSQGMGVVFESEQMNGGGGPSGRTGYRVSAIDSRGDRRS